jgi:hypothetical protein
MHITTMTEVVFIMAPHGAEPGITGFVTLKFP